MPIPAIIASLVTSTGVRSVATSAAKFIAGDVVKDVVVKGVKVTKGSRSAAAASRAAQQVQRFRS